MGIRAATLQHYFQLVSTKHWNLRLHWAQAGQILPIYNYPGSVSLYSVLCKKLNMMCMCVGL